MPYYRVLPPPAATARLSVRVRVCGGGGPRARGARGYVWYSRTPLLQRGFPHGCPPGGEDATLLIAIGAVPSRVRFLGFGLSCLVVFCFFCRPNDPSGRAVAASTSLRPTNVGLSGLGRWLSSLGVALRTCGMNACICVSRGTVGLTVGSPDCRRPTVGLHCRTVRDCCWTVRPSE